MLCFVKYVIVVDEDVRVVHRCRMVSGGDDCGWWCVLKGAV